MDILISAAVLNDFDWRGDHFLAPVNWGPTAMPQDFELGDAYPDALEQVKVNRTYS